MTTAAASGVGFLVGLGVLAVGPVVVFDVLTRGGVLATATDAGQLLEQSLWMAGIAAVAVLVLGRCLPPSLPWGTVRCRGVLATYVPFLLLWLGFLFAYLAVAHACGRVVAPQPQLRWLTACDLARPGTWAAIVAMVVLMPCAEEVVFRGFLQQALVGAVRPRFAIVIAAAVFGLAHTLPYALPVGLLGACFGYLAWRHASLWSAALAHMIHNGLTVLVTVLWPAHLDLLYPR